MRISITRARIAVIGLAAVASSSAAAVGLIARVSDGNQTYWVEQLAVGLKFPSAVAWLPNGDMLVTEREGGLRILRDSVLDPKPLSGVPPSFKNRYNGLKDIALDPDFQANHALYLFISEGTYDLHHAAIYRARYSSSGLTDLERIFRSKDDIGGAGQISGRMVFLADKTLLIGVPEDDKHKQMPQRLDSHIGKMVRINRNGSIPPDNPFLKTPGALPEIWSYGHRVQTGLYRDPQTALLWEIEPGPQGGDELNLLKAGANYGWPKATWGFEYGGGLAGSMNFAAEIEDPILIWMPAATPWGFVDATPAGLTRYRGTIYPKWDGDFFVGQLSGQALVRLRMEDTVVVLQEKMLMDLDERIRDVQVGPDNHLYILTDAPNGRVLRLQPGQPRADQLARVTHKIEQHVRSTIPYPYPEPGDPIKGKRAFLERCSGCHSVGSVIQGGHIGPDLAGVYGRNAGNQQGFSYSTVMANSPQIWNPISLDLFLTDPRLYWPGTKMIATPETDREVRWSIIGFLKQASEK